MKKSESLIIVVIVLFSAMVAYLVGQRVLGSMTQTGVSVKTIPAISSTVSEPDSRIFNTNAVNPTVQITIGNPSGVQPFGGSQ